MPGDSDDGGKERDAADRTTDGEEDPFGHPYPDEDRDDPFGDPYPESDRTPVEQNSGPDSTEGEGGRRVPDAAADSDRADLQTPDDDDHGSLSDDGRHRLPDRSSDRDDPRPASDERTDRDRPTRRSPPDDRPKKGDRASRPADDTPHRDDRASRPADDGPQGDDQPRDPFAGRDRPLGDGFGVQPGERRDPGRPGGTSGERHRNGPPPGEPGQPGGSRGSPSGAGPPPRDGAAPGEETPWTLGGGREGGRPSMGGSDPLGSDRPGFGPASGARSGRSRRSGVGGPRQSALYSELHALEQSMPEENVEKPYLERVPDGYEAELAVMEWIESLITMAGHEATLDALSYYRSIGWLSADAERTLEEHAETIATAAADGDHDFTMSDHRQSLRAIAQIARSGR